MIVRNEEGVLTESIESIRSIADEMLVLDTGSTDKTATAAWQLGVTLAKMPWRHNFSAARNRCLDLVTGDWVLWLDAGERLTAESAMALRTFVDQEADTGKVYLLTVEACSPDGGLGGEEIAQLRLAPTQAGLRFSGRVRETLRPAIEAHGMEVEAAPVRILRHPRQHDQAWKTLKADRNLTLAALEIAEHPAPVPRLLLTEGDAYCSLGMFDRARHAFFAALNAAPGASEILEAYYGLLTCYACDPFLAHHQLSVCVEALNVCPVDMQLLLTLGNCLYTSNHVDTAVRAFDTAVRFGQVNPEVWHLCDIDKVAELCLNTALGLRDGAQPARPAVDSPLADLPGRMLRVDHHGPPQETGSLHLPLPSDALSSQTISS
jgi:tetratricopeptide (TPR) repeat protein